MWATTWQNQQSECAPNEDSDQPGHPPSLIRVFAVRMKKAWVLSYPLSAQRSLWSDWADAQADLSLRWAHTHYVGFVMSWLNCYADISIKIKKTAIKSVIKHSLVWPVFLTLRNIDGSEYLWNCRRIHHQLQDIMCVPESKYINWTSKVLHHSNHL